VRCYLDTSVLLTAVGGEHRDRAACLSFLARARTAGDMLTCSVEVVQEFAFHRLRRTSRARALEDTADVRRAVVLRDFDAETLDLALELMAATTLRGRDALHAATARLAGLELFVTLDRDFDAVPGLAAVHPASFA